MLGIPSTARGNCQTFACAWDLADFDPTSLGGVMKQVPGRERLGPNLRGVIIMLASVLDYRLGIHMFGVEIQVNNLLRSTEQATL